MKPCGATAVLFFLGPGSIPMHKAVAAARLAGWLFCAVFANVVWPQVAGGWWIGFIDARDRALLEIPGDARACAARDAMARRGIPGSAPTAPLRPESQLPPGARLVFGVTDITGAYAERVMTRVVAITHEDEGRRRALRGPCWLLAEAGTDAPGYRVVEDRLAFGTHPPRALAVRAVDAGWRGYGPLADAPGADARFVAGADMPAAWRARVSNALPAATQMYGQAFTATLNPRLGPESLLLIGAIGGAGGTDGVTATYNTVNLIVREGHDEALYQAGPSGGIERDSAASFVAQVVAAVDLDGDGIDELVIRARYFAGGNIRVLKWSGRRYFEVRQTGYEGD